VQANLGRKLKVRSTAGTIIFSTNTNITRSRNKFKLQSTGQGTIGANRTSGQKLPNLAAGPRELANGNNGCAS